MIRFVGVLVALMGVVALSGCDSDGSDSVQTVTVPDNNNAPVAFAATFAVTFNMAFSADIAGSDPDIDPITFTLESQPANGTVSLEPAPGCGDMNACMMTYTPNTGFSGTDSFNFHVNDGRVDSNSATVTLNVSAAPPANGAPEVNDQFFETEEDTPFSAVLVATDPDGDPLTFSVVAMTGPSNGTLTDFNPDGSFTYSPNLDFVGDDSFVFEVSDGTDTAQATAFITVTECVEPVPADGSCGFAKFGLADDELDFFNADQPAIAVDTLLRVNVAYVEDHTPSGGTTQDLFVRRVSPTLVEPLAGSGVDGAINGANLANRPDLIGSAITPTTLALAWDEDNLINTASRDDILSPTWATFSGNPNGPSGIDGIDPVLTLDAVTSSPLVAWTSLDASDDILLATNTGLSLAFPGAWAPLDAPLDVTPANEANAPSMANDDVPGGGVNVAGRTNIAWNEVDGGVSQVYVKQCPNASDGMAVNCDQLSLGSLNVDPLLDAVTPSITVPNIAAEILTAGGTPGNPRPVVAFIENGNLFVKRYVPGSDTFELLADAANANGALNVRSDVGSLAASPAIVADILGRYTVTWHETFSETVNGVVVARSQIFAKRFDMTGVWTQLGGILNCNAAALSRDPDIAVDTLGIPYITYVEEVAGGDTRIPVIAFSN